jgi:hypothetical protein
LIRLVATAALLLAACFNPAYHDPRCGPYGECPNGLACVAGTCLSPTPMDDAATGDGAGTGGCVGSEVWQLCIVGAPPSAPVTLRGTINTDTSTSCASNVVWTSSSQPAACVIAGTSIDVSTNTTATGTKPLVLFSTSTIQLASGVTLDVASHRAGTTGAGAQAAGCGAFPQAPLDSTSGAGGAAGGSFMSSAGDGGAGGKGATAGLAAPADTVAPTILRGGCNGQTGGTAGAGSAGPPGSGGGAVFLVASTRISLLGTINASGAGGGGGLPLGGGGGGGSGGMIVLAAPSIMATNAKIIANGGGGGGSGGASNGSPGSDPSTLTPTTAAQGGTGGAGNGCGGNGHGGAGAVSTVAAVDGEAGAKDNTCGGGGGGGAVGYIQSNVAIGGATVSPSLTVIP